MKRSVRYTDARVRYVRHCDDVKDIALKVKAKAQELISQFKSMKNGQRVAIVLTKLIKLIGALYSAKSAVQLAGCISGINKWKKEAIKTTADWETYALQSDIAEQTKAKQILKYGVKALIGLVVVLVAQLKEKTIKAGIPSDYNEENYPNG